MASNKTLTIGPTPLGDGRIIEPTTFTFDGEQGRWLSLEGNDAMDDMSRADIDEVLDRLHEAERRVVFLLGDAQKGDVLFIECLQRIERMSAALAEHGVCSRCLKPIADFRPPDGGMTAGYYVAAAWKNYTDHGDTYICDACMWADPRYIADYGEGGTADAD